MAVTGLRPDFRTIGDFRQRPPAALAGLFGQRLRLCRRAGLVKLGHGALDGTRLAATASKHKAMSSGRMRQAEAALAAAVEGWLARAAREDAADAAAPGHDPAELPDWVAATPARRARRRAAKAALEAAADPPPPDAEPGPSSRRSDHGWPGARRTAGRRSGHSATAPTPTAGCSRPGSASSRATTAGSRSTARSRSSSPSA